MSVDPTRIPVVVGVGQSLEREALTDVVELAARAGRESFRDAPGLEGQIDRLSMVGVSFSKAGARVASDVARALGLEDVACEVTTPGGNTPQWLVNRAGEEIAAGRLGTTLIVGAEATRSMRLRDRDADFLRVAVEPAAEGAGEADPVVGASLQGMVGRAEIEARLLRPADVYPVFESVLAARAGASLSTWRERIAAFYARGSEVAAKHPFAWFPEALSAGQIATPGPDNRLTAEPYTKRMNSFANVDMGAALLVTNLATARAAGLEDRCVFPWAGATNADVAPTARPELGGSPAIRAAAAATFEAAGLGLDDVEVFDLYSCFPVAVEIGAAEIGLALDDPRGLTTTGFMAFFGGPGNNYTTHGIASTVARVREGARLAYVSGNGGLLSKHSIGLYGGSPPPRGFVRADTTAAQARIEAEALEVVASAEGPAQVDGGTVVYDRDGAVAAAPIVATLSDGRRVAAVAEPGLLPELSGRSLVGERVVLAAGVPPVYRV